LLGHLHARITPAQDSEDEISHLEWETVRVRLVKAGSLEKLVESLASDSGELESTYVNVFLATYRTFSTAHQVLTLITQRYQDLNQVSSASSSSSTITLPESVAQQHRKSVSLTRVVWLNANEFYCNVVAGH
jgi:ral guanine nucleotide dissociation stimulator-like 1